MIVLTLLGLENVFEISIVQNKFIWEICESGTFMITKIKFINVRQSLNREIIFLRLKVVAMRLRSKQIQTSSTLL